MTIHTMAYSNFSQGSDLNFDKASLDGVKDQAVTLSAQRRPIFSQDMSVIAGYAIHQDLVSAQIDAPTLRKIVSPYIVPITADWMTPSDPNAMCLLPAPWAIGRQEEIGVTVTVRGSLSYTPASPQVLLWLADRIEQVPRGDNYWIRYERSDDANDPQAASDAWTSVSVKFDQTLAAGRYAVIGFQHQCDGLLCARLIFDNQVFRPGTIAVPLTEKNGMGDPSYGRPSGARTAPMFYDGSLGVLGYFDSYAPPRIEVLALSGSVYDNFLDHEGYLRIVRVDGGTPGGSGLALPNKYG
jgi:hypothetical protein